MRFFKILALTGITLLYFNDVKSQIPDKINQVAWSPNGDKICFTADAESSSELFVINIDGSGLRQLTNDTKRDAYPSWSPDGQKIIYGKDVDRYNPRLYSINVDGSSEKELFDSGYPTTFGSYSPDGSKLVYMLKQDKQWQLYTYDFKSKRSTRALTSEASDFNPDWSPDGENILFESDRSGNNQDDIFILNTKTGGLSQVTNTQEYNDVYPYYSPAGDKILFLSLRNRSSKLFTINPDGTGEKKIANEVWYADWAPDGQKIVFVSYKNGIENRTIEIIHLKDNTRQTLKVK